MKEMDDSNMVVFFFSSRRRHTRLQGDWSSDVCSSDLFTSTFHILEFISRWNVDVNLVIKWSTTHIVLLFYDALEGGQMDGITLHSCSQANGAFQRIVPPYEAMDLDKKPHRSQFNHCNCNYIIIVEVENDPAQKSIIHHTTAAYNIII